MSSQDITEREVKQIQRCLTQHPTLLILGSSLQGRQRVYQAIMEEQTLDEGEEELVEANNHPDVTFLNGRETSTEEAKDVRDKLTALPSRWTKRYLVVTHLDRLHNAAAQSFLKLVEEPPQHLRNILITDRPRSILPTILSRSTIVEINKPTASETEDILTKLGLDEPAWRAVASGEDPDIGAVLDPEVLRNWHKVWAMAQGGLKPPADVPLKWTETLTQASNETQIAAWNLLVILAAKRPQSRVWQGIAQVAIKERERAYQGRSNKILTSTSIVKVYAYCFAQGVK